MGNSQTKEARSSLSPSHRRSNHPGGGGGRSPYSDRNHRSEGPRSGRSSRPDLSILGFAPSADRDVATLEHRRETRQERDARRLERERVARVKERERSMKEEHVDGGYLVTQGVYVGTEDFNKAIVRQLMIERRLAPFWRGLNDFSDSWTEHQLMAAARGLPVPPPDEIPPELEYKASTPKATTTEADSKDPQHLMVPITSRSQSCNSDGSQSSNPTNSLPSPASPIASGGFSSPLFRSRAKTLASTKLGSQAELTPREFQLPPDPFVNGQPLEAYNYKDAAECPICFLYYPPYLNRTRCCDQPICSECFVQIKRPEPHPPEHGEPEPTAPNPGAPAEEGERTESAETQLVSEPSACPFCVQPEFGVTYVAPPFRRGLTYASDPNVRLNLASPISSSTSSLSSGNPAAVPGRRRATSLSASDPAVVTTDKIRPDWAQKLANARAHAARRSAAATALHTAAYLVNSNGNDSRNFGLGRRGIRRTSGTPESNGNTGRGGSPALHALAFLTHQRAPPTQEAGPREEETPASAPAPAPPRGSSRRSRIDDLEEMMMMEAIRLSLASEEDRRKRDEKEIKKESKRREKEAKKVEKTVRKSGVFGNEASSSSLGAPRDGRLGALASSSSSVIAEGEEEEEEGEESTGKGKEVDRAPPSTVTAPEEFHSDNAGSSAGGAPSSSGDMIEPSMSPPTVTEPSKPSHLRHMSSASSSFSSLVESADEHSSSYPTTAEGGGGGQPSTEPMFNFRSLAAVIGDEEAEEEKGGVPAEHVEHTSIGAEAQGSTSGAAPPSTMSEVPDSGNTEKPSETVPERRECIMPKELETGSVEITETTQHQAI